LFGCWCTGRRRDARRHAALLRRGGAPGLIPVVAGGAFSIQPALFHVTSRSIRPYFRRRAAQARRPAVFPYAGGWTIPYSASHPATSGNIRGAGKFDIFGMGSRSVLLAGDGRSRACDRQQLAGPRGKKLELPQPARFHSCHLSIAHARTGRGCRGAQDAGRHPAVGAAQPGPLRRAVPSPQCGKMRLGLGWEERIWPV